MAHIAVQLQRTPQGLHPASAVALCWARDIGSARGATVTALCSGDAGDADVSVAKAAARFGADVLLFGGPSGLRNLVDRLNPVHVLVPYTPFGLSAGSDLEAGPPVARWIDRRSPPYATADAVTAVVAGVKPWHSFETELDPEYEGDVDAVELPAFARTDDDATDAPTPPVFDLGATPIGYVAPDRLDSVVANALSALGAARTQWEDAPHHTGGTTLVLADAADTAQAAKAALEPRTDTGRVLLLPGPDVSAVADAPADTVPARWRHVDGVFAGLWADVVASLREGPWTSSPA